MMALHPILRERKNFSVVLDDWWIYPRWLTRDADYIINRMYNGVAVRLGHAKAGDLAPPVDFPPADHQSLRRGQFCCFACPRWLRGRCWMPVNGFSAGVRRYARSGCFTFLFRSCQSRCHSRAGELTFDFSITGSVTGTWLMRDAYASFKHSFANLYFDRKRLMDLIVQFDGKPFKIYDWRRLQDPRPPQSWEDYVQLTRQSRYVVATGGLHNAGLPKHLEYACLGTPMIGRKTVFEFPWLDDCLFDVDITRLTAGQMKPLLDEAMDRQPVLRENCLRWREQLFKLHDIHALLDMLQAQADGQPIPPGYLKAGVLQSRPAPNA